MAKITIRTKKEKEVIDITDNVISVIEDRLKRSSDGVCCLFIAHTTASLTTADLDPGTDKDMMDAFAAMVPKLNYRHPHDPDHVPSHILSSLIGTSVNVPFESGKLILGEWQRIVLIEHDGPKEREIYVSIVESVR